MHCKVESWGLERHVCADDVQLEVDFSGAIICVREETGFDQAGVDAALDKGIHTRIMSDFIMSRCSAVPTATIGE